jgi:HD-GYP domain-containing protein (c-di-GMP phosphodiesterase class II)
MSVRFKIISAAVLTLTICITAVSIFSVRLLEQRTISTESLQATALGGFALREIEAATAEGHSFPVQEVLENVQSAPEVLSARILSRSGKVLSSSDPEDVGLDTPGFTPPGDDPQNIRSSNRIVYRIPVKNRGECFSCHTEAHHHIGIVEVVYDITMGRSYVLATKRFLMLAGLLTLMFVGGSLAVAVTRAVISPLTVLRNSIQSVKEGDMNARVRLSGRDEISSLSASYNMMLDEVQDLYERALKKERDVSRVKAELDHKVLLEELNAQLQHKVKEVESANKAVLSLSKELKHKNVELEKMVERLKRINEVGSVLSSIIDHEELLKLIIKTSTETLHVSKGMIHVIKSKKNPITVRFQSQTGFHEETPEIVELDPRFQDMLLEGKQVLVSNGESVRDKEEPALGVPLRMKGQIIGGILLEGRSEDDVFTHDELELLETMSNQAVVALENAWLYETVKANYFGTIQSLVNALEASDRYTKGHSERVRFLGLELAKHMGFDYRELEVLEHAAILHDIGKIGIDTSVLNKQEELTNTEFSLIRAHPIIGDEILGPIGTLEGVRTTILQHHERFDGKGYPYGISGEEITLKARILAVIDTFDAMLTDRPYRKALSMDQALEEVRKGSGTQFDPSVVKAFFDMVKEKDELLDSAGYSEYRSG